VSNTPPTESDVRAAIVRALRQVAPEVDPGSLRPDVNLRDQVDLDSMDFLNFVIGLSRSLGLEVPEADYPQLATLDGIVAYLLSHNPHAVS
jgi:acyl carrier protein